MVLRPRGVAEITERNWSSGTTGALKLTLWPRVYQKLGVSNFGEDALWSHVVAGGKASCLVFSSVCDLGAPSCLWLPLPSPLTHPPTHSPQGFNPASSLWFSPNLNTLFLPLSGRSH